MRRALWSVSALVAIFVTACASAATTTQPGGSGLPGTSGIASAVLTPGDPLNLVGLWQLDAPGQPAGSVLRLGDDLSIWSSCGYLSGEWRADPAGLFAGLTSGGSPGCVDTTQGDPTPPWLTRIVSFKVDAAGAQLLDATGAVVATLRPGGHPTPGPDIAAELAQQPPLTDNLRARLRAAAPLPAGLVAARPDQLVGRWISPGTPTLRGFAELTADGSWKGYDGANDQGGRWSAAPDGEMVVAAGAQTAAGCSPDQCANVGAWFESASRAAFDGPTLVLLDADGKETGRAVRAAMSPASTPRSASSAAVVSPAATSQPPSASASTCTSFALSLVSNTGGQPSPVAAAEWFARHGQVAGTPAGGWRVVSQGAAEASLQSGAVELHVFEGPDQTWQVDGGQHCP